MAQTTTSFASVRRARFIVMTLALFWVVVGVAVLIPVSGFWLQGLFDGQPISLFVLGSTGVASIAMAIYLVMRRAWARPAAVIYHMWFGGVLLLLALRPSPFYEALITQLPPWFTQNTWVTLLRSVLVLTAVVSLAVAYFLEQPSAWDAFMAQRTRRKIVECPICGATKQRDDDREFCPYCDTTVRVMYFLQPVLKNARRILLMFEPGHSRIRIGRSVGNGEAWIDAGENKRYRTISRHHADIELDFKTTEMTVYKAFTSQEVLVDDQPVLMSAPVKLGSLIQLGKVQFVLGNSDYEPTLAYFVDQNDEDKRHLLRFNGLDNEQKIGRSADCDVVIRGKSDVAHHHATIIFDPESQMFFIRNESERSPVYIDGHLLEPGLAQELSTQELIVLQIGSHNFNFLPVLYQPKIREASYV